MIPRTNSSSAVDSIPLPLKYLVSFIVYFFLFLSHLHLITSFFFIFSLSNILKGLFKKCLFFIPLVNQEIVSSARSLCMSEHKNKQSLSDRIHIPPFLLTFIFFKSILSPDSKVHSYPATWHPSLPSDKLF